MRLKKRGRIWWLDYQVRGKRYRQSTGCTVKADAFAYAERLGIARRMPTFEAAVEVLRHFYAKDGEGRTPLENAWETYADLAHSVGKDAVESRTWQRRHNILARFVKWCAKFQPDVTTVDSVTGKVAAAFAASLATDRLKTKTRANVLGELNTIWKTLEKASTIIRNPWGSLSPRCTDGERGRAFSREQEAAVMVAALKVGKQWPEICTLMRHTGLRYSDVARLKWSAIRGDVLYLTPNKTARYSIEVAIPLNSLALAAVKRTPRVGDYLFPLHSELYGKRGRQARETLNFREVLDLAGVTGSGYSIHSWRHTAATRLAESGADSDLRKRILGHRTDSMAEHYDHAAHLSELREALEAAAG